jgi:hypothetical protein
MGCEACRLVVFGQGGSHIVDVDTEFRGYLELRVVDSQRFLVWLDEQYLQGGPMHTLEWKCFRVKFVFVVEYLELFWCHD